MTDHGLDCPICPPDEKGRPSCPPNPDELAGLIERAQDIMNRSAQDEHLDTGDALEVLRELAALKP